MLSLQSLLDLFKIKIIVIIDLAPGLMLLLWAGLLILILTLLLFNSFKLFFNLLGGFINWYHQLHNKTISKIYSEC
jgi:hypothetical protein